MPPKLKLPKKKENPSFTQQPKPSLLTQPLYSHSNGDDFHSPTSVISLRKTPPSSISQPSKLHKKPRFCSESGAVSEIDGVESRVCGEVLGDLDLKVRACFDEKEGKCVVAETVGLASRVCSERIGKEGLNLGLCFDEKEEKCGVGESETVDLSSRVCWSLLDGEISERQVINCGDSCNLLPEFDENGGILRDSSPVESQIMENSYKTKVGFSDDLKENCSLESVEPNLVDSSVISCTDKFNFNPLLVEESVEPNLVDSSVISSTDKLNFNPPLFEESNKLNSIDKKSPKEKCGYESYDSNPKGKYHLKSIESKLVESRYSKSKSDTYESESDSEQETKLNELMSVLERDIEFDLSDQNGLIACPLCGVDLSDLSEESRQLHTNVCLDSCENSEAPDSVSEAKSNLNGGNVDTKSVIEWIRNLGLSKYEDIFVREEIDWDTLQSLTEEDLLNIGITTLGSRKKIMNALRELQNTNNDNNTGSCVQNTTTNSTNCKETNKPTVGNKLITQYFIGSGSKPKSDASLTKPVQNNIVTNITTNSSVVKRNSKKKGGKKVIRDVPLWCCIPGTPFRVDAFRNLEPTCSHWFLTHFHMDHYQGLTKKFCHGKIYCSAITARLVNLKIGVPMEKMHILALNEKLNIAGVNIYCFDANHCPGSVILLFEPPNGKAVLHTGDFRFSPDMKNNSILQLFRINTLILDTTYCNPQYDFPKQEAVIQFVIEAIQAEAFNPRTLFLIGSYTIGKERLFLEVARVLKKKIYVNAAKLSILRCLELPQEQMQWLTANEAESNIHVVPMWTLASFKRMKYVSNQYAGRYDLIVAFSPTGWSFGKGTKRANGKRMQQGTIIRYEVPYSEHSSFTELREFVRFVSAENIIPSVNNAGPHSADNMLSLLLSDL